MSAVPAWQIEAAREPAASARSRLYCAFADAFDYPQGERLQRWCDGRLAADLEERLAALPWAMSLPAGLTLDSGSEGAAHYSALFDIGTGRPKIALLERSHDPGRPALPALWEDLLRYYRYFGLDFARRAGGAPPDHLLLELEFMHYLGFLETAIAGSRDDLRRAQRDFLERHLARWTGPLAARLAAQAADCPYGALSGLLDDFVQADLQWLRAPRFS
ncbi:MAG TPA: molecular chaperone TorD family protein [Gammaproteobacteria bacterium]|mgnify:CR=1 FL=1|nr:molecular chaperone TorD family protein [Gammaproteobacteria bacterium]